MFSWCSRYLDDLLNIDNTYFDGLISKIYPPELQLNKANSSDTEKKVREKSRECHNHKPQPLPDPKRKRKPTNLNKHKPNKRTKSTKISSLFPKQGNRNTKRTEKHKNKMTHGKTYNKSPRRINQKATRSRVFWFTFIYCWWVCFLQNLW